MKKKIEIKQLPRVRFLDPSVGKVPSWYWVVLGVTWVPRKFQGRFLRRKQGFDCKKPNWKALPTRILSRQKQIRLLSETHLKIFIKCLDLRSSSEADSLNFFNFLCKKTSAVEIHRLQLMIAVIADRHQEILGIYCKWPFKRPGRLFNFRSPSGGV